jgi:Na+/H+-dicarboxylate symporter
MATVLLGLTVHALITLPLLLKLVGGANPIRFFGRVAPALTTAFSTASSSATLPLTIDCVETKAKVPSRVASFVLPLGATINMDGTALYESVAAVFIAQVYGIDLSLGQQVLIFLTATLAAIGAAGIPSAGLVTMAIVLNAVGLPLEGIGMILAVDRILDMCRTSVNVWGDTVGCVVVARLNGEATPAEIK